MYSARRWATPAVQLFLLLVGLTRAFWAPRRLHPPPAFRPRLQPTSDGIAADTVFQATSGTVTAAEVLAAIETYGRLNQPDAAERVFDRASFVGIPCGVDVYNALLAAWADGLAASTSGTDDLASRAEEVFRRMAFADVAPDLRSYEIMFDVWRLMCTVTTDDDDDDDSDTDSAINTATDVTSSSSSSSGSSGGAAGAADKCVAALEGMAVAGLAPSMRCYERTLQCIAESR
jgi:hypothetical protein